MTLEQMLAMIEAKKKQFILRMDKKIEELNK